MYVTVAETLDAAIARLPDDFSKSPVHPDANAIMLPDGTGAFALCFVYGCDLNEVVHELFHLTHEILDRTNSNFDIKHDEQGALLIGWLTAKVTKQLRKWKVDL